VVYGGSTIAALGLALWCASLWVVSYRHVSPPGRDDFTVALMNGELWATTGGSYFPPGLSAMHAAPRAQSISVLRWWPEEPLFGRRALGPGVSIWSLRLPLWLPVAVGAAGAGAFLPAWIRDRRRRREGKCAACGYDVRGLAGRCPECGRGISRPLDP